MKLLCYIIALLPLALNGLAAADVELRTGCTAHFASVTEAAEILGQKDDFIQRLSPFDRASRMKTDKPVSEEEFLAFLKANVAAWSDVEQRKIEAAIAALRPAFERLTIAFPKKIVFIKTTGAEEGRAFYTRDTAVMMPEKETDEADIGLLKKTIAHELFHILSRANPALREKLYGSIGFTNCGEVEFPSELKSRKITNPDAPRNDHAIRVRVGGKEVSVVPILFSNTPRYDPARGGEFFSYLQFKFLLLTKMSAVRPELATPEQVSGFFEQVGRNTNYVIHPEEILADNFSLLILGERSVPSPEILEKMQGILDQK
jgi:hypothetical protein